MKRIAVISDIHGNILALEKVIDDIAQRDVDLIVNLGDHVSGPLWPKETVEYLKRQEWIQILGNHDRQLVSQDPSEHGLSDLYASQKLSDEDLNWIRTLPANAEINKEISAFHGSPADDLVYQLETIEMGRARLAVHSEIKARLGNLKTPIILCGHSHIPRIVELPDGQLIVNPGSVGLPAYEDQEPEPHVMETGSSHARYAILENQGEGWIVKLMAISYNHQKAVKQAHKNGRNDWALGLGTGYMNT